MLTTCDLQKLRSRLNVHQTDTAEDAFSHSLEQAVKHYDPEKGPLADYLQTCYKHAYGSLVASDQSVYHQRENEIPAGLPQQDPGLDRADERQELRPERLEASEIPAWYKRACRYLSLVEEVGDRGERLQAKRARILLNKFRQLAKLELADEFESRDQLNHYLLEKLNSKTHEKISSKRMEDVLSYMRGVVKRELASHQG